MNSFDRSELSADTSALRGLTPAQKDRLTDVLDRYLSSLENGVPPPREELFAAHPDLAEALETYLKSLDELHDVAAGFARPPCRSEAELTAPDSDEKRLGDFRILREIGRGGMGVVYEAHQISLGRRVALKVLPFAAILDSKQIARFKHEAQAAAQLDHPNIVSVFAVGVERGVHYYAMRLIDGQPLDRALEELRKTARPAPSTVADRETDTSVATGRTETTGVCFSSGRSLLTTKSANHHEYFRTVMRLGIQAAEALHAAHEQGIVHRDIKPSNLLLDANGSLWVTDFGLARCRTDAALTRTGDIVGTARYMSPEQALGQSALVDHRTDVYSLGVTLYELLALQPAFPHEDGPALLRRIEEQEPQRLRQLQPKIPSDLETVVQKAMAKRREDRYDTAREFADDLRRVVEGKPTVARPPTIPDRVGKWTRRHKRIVATVVTVCLLAMLGMAASTLLITREKLKADQNYARAERHFREARDAVDRFGVQLAERLADVPGAYQVRSDLLKETVRYYREFLEQAKDDPALRTDLALTYSKIGTLTAEIGSYEEAIAAHESAIGLFEKLAAENPSEAEYRRRLAVSKNNVGLVLSRSGRTDAARQAYGDAILLQKDLVDQGADAQPYLGDLALSHNNLGLLQSETSEAGKAETSFREAIRLQEHLLELDRDNPEHLRNLAASLNNLSSLYLGQKAERAVDLYKKALTYQERAAAIRPADLKIKSNVALTYNNLGAVDSRLGQLAEAAAAYTHAVEIQGELARAAPLQRAYRHDLAVGYNNLGMVQSKLRQAAGAERSFRQALNLEETLARQTPLDLDLQSSLGGIYNNLGILLEELRRTDEAAASYKQAVEHQRIACSRAPKVSRYRLFLSKHYYNYGRVLRQLGHPDDAARVAIARRELWPNDAQHLFAVAEELGLATGLFDSSTRTEMTSKQCAELAVETLRQAAAAGWKPARNLDSLESFAALKDYPGFAELVKK